MEKEKKCLVIDGNNLVYRSYHASKKLSWMKENKEVYIFLKIIISIIKKNKYEKLFVAFDKGKENFRKKISEDYKAKRNKVPEELIKAIEEIKNILKIMNIAQESIENFEGDDLIASFIDKFEKKEEFEFHVLSQDKDLFQLISKNVKILRYKNGIIEKFGEKEFFLENGFPSNRFMYYLSLKGDEIDNVKGVEGIGKKRAKIIVSKFKDVEETFFNLDLLPLELKVIIQGKRKEIEKSIKIVSLEKKLLLKEWKDYNFSWKDLKNNKNFIDFCEERKMKSIISYILH